MKTKPIVSMGNQQKKRGKTTKNRQESG